MWMKRYERAISNLLAESGLIPNRLEAVPHLVAQAGPILNPRLLGEAVLTVGAALADVPAPYCGVIALGPFVGGWLLQTTSYTMLFAATTCVVLLGFIISLRLEPPQAARVRHVDHVPSTESQETQSA